MSEAEATTQETYTADDASPEPQEHWTVRDKDKLQELYEQSAQPSSCSQTRTESGGGEEELLPGTSVSWLKTEEEDDGYERSANFWQPLSSDSAEEHDTSDADYTEKGGSNSCVKAAESKVKAKQKASRRTEQEPPLPQTPPFASMMMQLQAKTATLPLLPPLTTGKRKRCQSCPKKKDNKTRTICLKCQKYICKAHCQTFTYCLTCI